MFKDGDKAVGDDGDVNLYPHSILVVAPETFDLEMLLDSFEEKLDLPTVTVEQGDVLCSEIKVIGIVHKRASEVFCIIDNPAQFCRIISNVVFASKPDCLVDEYTVLSVEQVFTTNNLKLRFPFLPDDEESSAEMDPKKPCEVEIPAVEDIAGIGFVINPVHSLVVADFGIGDSIEYRYLGDDVDLCMDFDARLCTTEERPSKDGHTEVDGSGIDGIKLPVEFKLFGDSPSLGKI